MSPTPTITRTHHRTSTIMLTGYVLAFLIFATILTIFEHSPAIILISLALILLSIYTLNYIYINHLEEASNSIELQSSIFSAALREEYDFCFLLSEGGNVIYADPRFYEKVFLHTSHSINELESILRFLEIRSTYAEELIEAIYEKKEWHKTIKVESGYNSHANVYLKHFSLSDRALGSGYTSRPAKFIMLKISYTDKDGDSWGYLDNLGIGFYELDQTGYLVNYNDFLARMLGYTIEESMEEVKLSDHLDCEIQTDKSIKSYWQGQANLITKFREKAPVLLIHKPFYSNIGGIDKIVGIIVKLQDNIIFTSDSNRDLLDLSWQYFFKDSPNPIAFANHKGQLQQVNKKFQLLAPSNIRHIVDLCSPNSSLQDELIQAIHSATDNPQKLDNININKDKIVDIYLTKIPALYNQSQALLVRLTDKTEQQELKHNLSHMQRMQTIGYLAGSIAHDFNNILTAISGSCDLLFLRHTAGDPSFEYIMQIKQSSNRATSLVSRLLAFSRKQTLRPKLINLNELFSDLASMIKRLIGTHITFNQEIAHDIWYIKVDPVQFEQVILNLVVNAHHAMDNHGTLSIKVYNKRLSPYAQHMENYYSPTGEDKYEAGEYVAIEVKDTGTGISPEIIDKIFEPFFTIKSPNLGTGLGLSTVYGIIKQSGGYISLKTELGKGTTFLILLKRSDFVQDTEHKVENDIKRDFSGQANIILVEDEEAVRIFAQKALTSKGYKVFTYEDPVKALDAMKQGNLKVDLIITDVVMPEMNGPTLIEKAKKLLKPFKVIFISGYGEDVFDKVYGDSRDFHFIPKPFALKELFSKAKEVLDS